MAVPYPPVNPEMMTRSSPMMVPCPSARGIGYSSKGCHSPTNLGIVHSLGGAGGLAGIATEGEGVGRSEGGRVSGAFLSISLDLGAGVGTLVETDTGAGIGGRL